MARLEKEITLKDKDGNDQKFFLTQYDAFKGIAYQKKLMKILVPSFIAFQQSTQENFIVNILEKFMENIDQVEPAFLKELVISGANKEGRVAINFENDFAGNYAILFSLIQELIMFNFSDVFQILGSQQ